MSLMKMIHLILPIILIIILSGILRLRIEFVVLLVFAAGFAKEIYDTIYWRDSLWISFLDILANVLGIILGVIFLYLKKLSILYLYRN